MSEIIKAVAIDKGMFLMIKNAPYYVVDREFVNPGKGSAFCRLKLKNLLNGQGLATTMKSNEDVEVTEVTECNCQYMYADDENYYFMESESFEQFAMPRAGMEEKIYYIREGEEYRVIKWEGNPVDIKLPAKMVFVVAEGSEGIKGDTVTKTTKPVKTETGLVVKVPLFIKEGEKILVNTETGEYQERVNK